jgi:hypothetical protein
MMSVVVMTSDKGKCVGLALGEKYPTAASPLETKFRVFSKSDLTTDALPHGKVAI